MSDHGFRMKSIAMSIEWLDDITPSNFWVRCKDFAGVATQGTTKIKIFRPRMLRGFTSYWLRVNGSD
ncbi:hypothetical protein CY34DRAFT_813139 [Suillus luteus UH-Slu-Lm8-n1]|uniref:Uncharacterized protein n=1 Tax=Suillus luteus UH-Slu-Lm8-n1 TaxID=930992 RepID=A0A0D0A7G2_9AGAM|nr:hypothetical protein CY34DRAFT_813139 [Suillus luteus UH-Slu-Lm8-n1]